MWGWYGTPVPQQRSKVQKLQVPAAAFSADVGRGAFGRTAQALSALGYETSLRGSFHWWWSTGGVENTELRVGQSTMVLQIPGTPAHSAQMPICESYPLRSLCLSLLGGCQQRRAAGDVSLSQNVGPTPRTPSVLL